MLCLFNRLSKENDFLRVTNTELELRASREANNRAQSESHTKRTASPEPSTQSHSILKIKPTETLQQHSRIDLTHASNSPKSDSEMTEKLKKANAHVRFSFDDNGFLSSSNITSSNESAHSSSEFDIRIAGIVIAF